MLETCQIRICYVLLLHFDIKVKKKLIFMTQNGVSEQDN